MRFFVSLFIIKANFFRVPSPLSWHKVTGSEMKPPIIQWETPSDFLHVLNVPKSIGPDGIHPRL